jgi:TRAP-type C4-dicarboxylate transport system permease small subunit
MINPLDNPNEIAQVTGNDGSLRQMILKYINFFLYFLCLVATAFVIYGGFLYITSQGDDGNVEKAKKILTFAAIGIFIILISFALINTVLTAGTGLQSATL